MSFVSKFSCFTKIAIGEYLLEHTYKNGDFLKNAKICFKPIISGSNGNMGSVICKTMIIKTGEEIRI
jgi:hypothetical protein